MAKAIPDSSLILVTGMSGFIGAHIGNELWSHGYNVRAAVRSLEKGRAIQEYAEKHVGKGRLEIVVIDDFTREGAFDDAVKGVSGIVHAAMSVDPVAADTYEKSIHPAVAGALSILRSAGAHGGSQLKRVVMTSSSVACGNPSSATGSYQYFDANTWHSSAIEDAKKDLGDALYPATKYESEVAAWKWVKENKPQFVVNMILPNANLGPALPFTSSKGSTYTWVANIAKDDYSIAEKVVPQWHIDVRDTAILHRIALVEPSVESERLWLVSAPFTWNSIIALVAHYKPGFKPRYLSGDKDQYDHTFIDNSRTRELIRQFGGRDELRTLDVSVRDCLSGTI